MTVITDDVWKVMAGKPAAGTFIISIWKNLSHRFPNDFETKMGAAQLSVRKKPAVDRSSTALREVFGPRD